MKFYKNILFLDIETVPQTEHLSELSPELQHLWQDKAEQIKKRNPDKYSDDTEAINIFSEAGIYAEFGKIVCISVGFIWINGNNKRCFNVKSYYGDDEKKILADFCEMLNNNSKGILCGHNSKEFDIPYIARRILINGLKLPDMLNVAGKKPWEINFLDTMDLWKFGDYKHYTPLKLLCAVFNIPTPKDDIDGSQVAEVYYKEKDVKRIAVYCEKDVLATAQVYLKMTGDELIDTEYVFHK